MKFINGWRFIAKDHDRVHIKIRISVLTILELYWDMTQQKWRVVVLNFGIEG